ncbi:MAG: efflux RND transporter periplasmic adaptor subunit [Candidatus Eisenbacteria bacterium]
MSSTRRGGGQEAACARAQAARLRLLRLGVAEEEVAGLESGGRSAAGVLLMRAPFAGEVVSIYAAPGEWVEEGTAVLLLADMSKLWIWVDLYERHLTAVDGRLGGGDAHAAPAPGADGSPAGSGRIPAEVLVRAYSNERFLGEIDFVERMMSEETRTIRGRVVIDNPDGRLKPGMFASVRVAIERGPAGLTVPAGAVLSDEGRDFAFVHVRDDYFLRRCVKTGRAVDGVVEIVDGLESGQTVAAAGAFLLKSDVLREKMGAGCAD